MSGDIGSTEATFKSLPCPSYSLVILLSAFRSLFPAHPFPMDRGESRGIFIRYFNSNKVKQMHLGHNKARVTMAHGPSHITRRAVISHVDLAGFFPKEVNLQDGELCLTSKSEKNTSQS